MQCGVGPRAILLIIGAVPPDIHLNETGAGADHTPLTVAVGGGHTHDLTHHTADHLLAGGTAPTLLMTTGVTHQMLAMIEGGITDPSPAAFPHVKGGG